MNSSLAIWAGEGDARRSDEGRLREAAQGAVRVPQASGIGSREGVGVSAPEQSVGGVSGGGCVSRRIGGGALFLFKWWDRTQTIAVPTGSARSLRLSLLPFLMINYPFALNNFFFFKNFFCCLVFIVHQK